MHCRVLIDFADPFVKATLCCAGRKLKKKKTATKRSTLNPAWNEALVFNLSKKLLKSTQIDFVLYSDNLIGNNDVLGRLTIGPDASNNDYSHWLDMVNSKNAMARWHSLKTPEKSDG